MAEKRIDELVEAQTIANDDLFVLEQSGQAKKLRGSTFKQFISTIDLNQIESVEFDAQFRCVITLTDGTVITSPPLKGEPGEDGNGVPEGGTTGQVLVKVSGADYDTRWADQQGGGGGTPTWGSVQEKPFEEIGTGLTVEFGVLKASGGIPTPTVADNGKFLSVVNGSAAWVSISNAAGNTF